MNRSLIIAVIVLAVAVVGGAFYMFGPGSNGAERQFVGVDGPTTPEQDSTAPAAPSATTPRGDEATGFSPSADKYAALAAVTNPSTAQEYLAIHATDTIIGNANAPVTVMEFFSYQCGFCKQFYEGVYQQVLSSFVNQGQVKFVKREYLLNRETIGLELLAGAGAQCFLDAHQHEAFSAAMFVQQGSLSGNPAEALVPLFVQAGLDEAQARTCMADDRNRTLVFMRAIQAQQQLGVSGTPTLFINGQRYAGNPSDFNQLSTALNAAIAQAN